jgi:OmpA-OmpF porin, OOP family
MKHSHWMLAAAGAALSLGVAAQSPTVLKGSDITEGALIEALTPKGGTDAGVTSRSIRVTRDDPGKKPQASILITFETNSANLTDSARSSVDVVAKALQADKLAGLRFNIEGHADPRGGADFNRRLSQARAESVVAYLVARHGIARERLTPVGKGDSELMNAARPDAAENRRVTITTVR